MTVTDVEYPVNYSRRKSKAEAAKLIVDYLTDPIREDHERTVSDIADNTRLSYSTTRRMLIEYFPHAFIYSKLREGWYTTGKPLNNNGGPTDFDQPYDQNALRYLDVLAAKWPPKRFREVLADAHKAGKLDELRILGETLARAATETKTLNAIPEKLRR